MLPLTWHKIVLLKGVVSKVVSVIADLFRDLDSVVLKAIPAQGRNDLLAYFDF
ncbi:MAG: hypothetical protein HWD62_01935 [Cyclobacteriaceae bacterium]|nr:MAG: hypothetical protein HWD62_01935 [Cyclobacteriaceae bacterium]